MASPLQGITTAINAYNDAARGTAPAKKKSPPTPREVTSPIWSRAPLRKPSKSVKKANSFPLPG